MKEIDARRTATHKDAMEINKEDGQSASEWALPVCLAREWPRSPLALSACLRPGLALLF